jgi:hypothetical protein
MSMVGIKTTKRVLGLVTLISVSLIGLLVAQVNTATNNAQTDTHSRHPSFFHIDQKLDPLLWNLISSRSLHESSLDDEVNRNPLHMGFIPVSLWLDESPSSTIKFIDSLGGISGFRGPDYLEALVSIELIKLLSVRKSILRMSLIQSPQIMDSNGVGDITRSLIWNQGEYRGALVKVGIIDGGFVGMSDLMGVELPNIIYSRCYISIFESTENIISDCEKITNHGTSVAEIIVDVAPEVILYVSNPRTPAAMRDAVEWMVANNVAVINHSMGWPWDGPGDGTSPRADSPLNSVDFAVENGVTWVNGVGNEAKSTWFGPFLDNDQNSLLDFGRDSNSNFIQLDEGKSTTIQLRWEDSWSAARTDLNLYVYPFGKSISESVAWSTSVQSGSEGQIPVEVITYKPNESGRFSFSVQGHSGPFPEWVQVQAYTSENIGFYSQGYSISNPAESSNKGLLSVGYADVGSTLVINSNSGRGPTTDGRVKPDIVGPDGLNTLSRGVWSGSSQSSSYVAGLAALVKGRFPNYSPVQVSEYLKNFADPRGETPNNIWGYGFAKLPFLEPTSPLELSVFSGVGAPYISWSEPHFDGGTPLTGYLLRGDLHEESMMMPPGITSETLGELHAGHTYKVEVFAVNQQGKSIPSHIFVEALENGDIKVFHDSTENQAFRALGLGLPSVGDDYFAGFQKFGFLFGIVIIAVGSVLTLMGANKKAG